MHRPPARHGSSEKYYHFAALYATVSHVIILPFRNVLRYRFAGHAKLFSIIRHY